MPTNTPFQQAILQGIPDELPPVQTRDTTVSHAPRRVIDGVLTVKEKQLALRNALRYFHPRHHAVLAHEFANNTAASTCTVSGPTTPCTPGPSANTRTAAQQAAAIMLMIQNNLDPKVAKHPHELITYGGNGAVFQNWAQYLLTMRYLSEMTETRHL
jgi:urocanate hydratase